MILALSFASLLAAPAATQSQPKPCPVYVENVYDERFEPGQVWSYHTRLKEESSTLTILKIDRLADGSNVIAVRIDLPSTTPYPGLQGFYAFRRDSLDASVTQMLKIAMIPYFRPEYDRWQDSCESPTYSTSVADMLATKQALLYPDPPAHPVPRPRRRR